MAGFTEVARAVVIVALAAVASGCDGDRRNLRDRFDDQLVRTQLQMREAVEGPKQTRQVEAEFAERQALEEDEATLQAIAEEDAAALEQKRLASEAAARAQKNPYGGAPASELSSQLRP